MEEKLLQTGARSAPNWCFRPFMIAQMAILKAAWNLIKIQA